MLKTYMQTSQQQQQQLMEATQSQQQATTDQLLQTLSSLVASMVPGAIPPATAGSHVWEYPLLANDGYD
jgi:peroxiredoxin